jgi:hypothetical protein
MNTQNSQSKQANEYKMLAKCIAMIHSSGDQGIKRGILYIKAGIKFSQFQVIHSILKDWEDIEWIKETSTYKSMVHHD